MTCGFVAYVMIDLTHTLASAIQVSCVGTILLFVTSQTLTSISFVHSTTLVRFLSCGAP